MRSSSRRSKWQHKRKQRNIERVVTLTSPSPSSSSASASASILGSTTRLSISFSPNCPHNTSHAAPRRGLGGGAHRAGASTGGGRGGGGILGVRELGLVALHHRHRHPLPRRAPPPPPPRSPTSTKSGGGGGGGGGQVGGEGERGDGEAIEQQAHRRLHHRL